MWGSHKYQSSHSFTLIMANSLFRWKQHANLRIIVSCPMFFRTSQDKPDPSVSNPIQIQGLEDVQFLKVLFIKRLTISIPLWRPGCFFYPICYVGGLFLYPEVCATMVAKCCKTNTWTIFAQLRYLKNPHSHNAVHCNEKNCRQQKHAENHVR